MTLRQFYDWQTMGGGSDVSALVRALEEREMPWCMIGGLAVNHWAEEPMATADVDEAVSALRDAGLEDTLAGKVAAYGDAARRASKRQKALADIARLIEAHPSLRPQVPPSILERLES